MINDVPTSVWGRELENLFLRVGACFVRVGPRRRMRDYVRGLLGPVGRKNGWQLAEYAGHATPDGLQHLLARSCWDADRLRDELQFYAAEQLVLTPSDDGASAPLVCIGVLPSNEVSQSRNRGQVGCRVHPAHCGRPVPTVVAA
ncbi:transposase [Streptomyces sp. NPDC059349]|uniref:transposase n=1 Tax=Streptomyces sp. NPDC059349 TaxID=3346808 RepID=UPI0036D0A6C5